MNTFRPALLVLLAMTLFTGIVYPLVTTGIAAVFFPKQRMGLPELLSNKTSDPRFFWPRPSAADFATIPSGASNLAPSSKALLDFAQKAAKSVSSPEMMMTSGSGLDPHMSPEAALSQIDRICKARDWTKPSGDLRCDALRAKVNAFIEKPTFGFLGRTRVNVNRINEWVNQQ